MQRSAVSLVLIAGMVIPPGLFGGGLNPFKKKGKKLQPNVDVAMKTFKEKDPGIESM